MPNHFHLLLYQNDETAIAEFMRTLCTSYTMYFNRRNERVGHLFQGRYKARKIDSDAYNLHITRYIHLNPQAMESGYKLYPYSSMRFILRPEIRPRWLLVDSVLSEHYGSIDHYVRFIDEYAKDNTVEDLHDLYGLD